MSENLQVTTDKESKKICFSVAVSPAVLLDEIEAAESEGNDDRIEGLLCGAVKQLKMNRAKPDITLYLSLMFLAKIKPNVFATEGIIEVILLTQLFFSTYTQMNNVYQHYNISPSEPHWFDKIFVTFHVLHLCH